jgi:hypothetical protein
MEFSQFQRDTFRPIRPVFSGEQFVLRFMKISRLLAGNFSSAEQERRRKNIATYCLSRIESRENNAWIVTFKRYYQIIALIISSRNLLVMTDQ